MSTAIQPPRTYNQSHVPRKYTPGKRRLSIYWTWSYPWEANRDVAEMDNRFSTMTEVRRRGSGRRMKPRSGVQETSTRESPARWSCSTAPRFSFQQIAGEATGHPVAVFQRIDQAGYKLPIDERILADTDTLMVFGLDHLPCRAGGGAGGNRGDPRVAQTRRQPACCSRRTTMSASPAT